MKTRVQKWGNSLAPRIPRPLAAGANVAAGTTVDIELREGRLIVERTRSPHCDLDDLLAGIDATNLHTEIGTGTRTGREIW
ncbi:MAG: AbrB/MazE/SpoVT family DNA-binding domain-containing protein [Spirochaetaceae bacterium]|nr:AbrB/MazE/SpoVT family DNA-binding domain-containing protein [Spirochaetaceae bacterium]